MPKGRSDKRYFGELGEDFAEKLLIKAGYKIVEKNFRSRFGEIDLIAKDGDTLVFIEVKTRWSDKFGRPEEAVDTRKLRRIKLAGEYFSLKHPTLSKKLRIDVVAITLKGGRLVNSKIIKVY